MPERRFIASLLDYIALGKKGTLKDMSEDTGIPMGKSTGKLPAIVDYSLGMGLIQLHEVKNHIKIYSLTPFGKIIYLEDKFLGEEMTQWLVHMNLCRFDIGARAWNVVFTDALDTIGSSFSKSELENYLISLFGIGKDRTGPMLITYLEDAALKRAGILEEKGEIILRKKAPIIDTYTISYSAYILNLLEIFFPEENQVTLDDFQEKTKWFDICLWDQGDIDYIFSLIERKGYISVDRQMHPWIIEKKSMSVKLWPYIFDDIA